MGLELLTRAAFGIVVSMPAGATPSGATPSGATPSGATPSGATPTESSAPSIAASPSEGVECRPPQPAFLSIATSPWTRVFIDGVQVGTTPLFRHALPPGQHFLEFTNAEHGIVGAEEVELDEAELRKLKLVFLTDAEASR